MNPSLMRARWAAVGAAVAVTLGAGGITMAGATIGSGERNTFVPVKLCTVFKGSIGPNKKVVVNAKGKCGLGTSFTALQTRVTVTRATKASGVSLYPTGAAKPSSFQLLPKPGLAPSSEAVAVNSNGGRFVVYNKAGTVTLTVAVEGRYENHVHDDRYYTKTQTDASRVVTQSFALVGIRWIASNSMSTFNSCQTRPTGASATGFVPLSLPVGATVLAAKAVVFDTSTTATYSVRWNRAQLSSSGVTTDSLGFKADDAAPANTNDVIDFPLATPWVVASGDSSEVQFSTSLVNENGFCSFEVTYRLPAVG